MAFKLFLYFFRIGWYTFGGFSMIPLINSEMAAHHWMTGVRPMCIGLISYLMLWKYKLSIPKVVLLAAIMGILFYTV